jgi:acyl transferase domain-containing protein
VYKLLLTISRRLRKFPCHELLGSRILEGNDLEPTWRNLLNLEAVPWIRDHKLQDDIVFPAAGYISMAGEASRQLSGIEAYTLRNIVIKTALVLKEDFIVELVTSLRPSRLTDDLNSAWYDFTISSFNGSIWVKHCMGQTKPGGGKKSTSAISSLPRVVALPYEGMKSIGLNYGPHFQGLRETSAGPGSGTATGKILAPTTTIQDAYQLHPTTIDCCLQLFMIAASEGVARRLDRLFVPTQIAELYIGNITPTSGVMARATSSANDMVSSLTGSAVATSLDGDVVLSLTGGNFSSVEEETEEKDNVAGAEIIWKPDIDFISIDSLIRPHRAENVRESWLLTEELSLTCMIEMRHRLQSTDHPALQHLQKYRSWLDSHLQEAKKAGHVMAQTVREGEDLSCTQRCEKIEILAHKAMASKAPAVADLVKRVFDNCEDLFHGCVEALELLHVNEGLTKFYNELEDLSDYSDFFSTLGHSNTRLRILEIGAGTGGTTSRVLNSLKAPNGVPMFAKYWYDYSLLTKDYAKNIIAIPISREASFWLQRKDSRSSQTLSLQPWTSPRIRLRRDSSRNSI